MNLDEICNDFGGINVMYIDYSGHNICLAAHLQCHLGSKRTFKVLYTSLLLPTYTLMCCEYTIADEQPLKQHVQVVTRTL